MKSLPSVFDLASAPRRDLFAPQRQGNQTAPPCFRLARIVAGETGTAGNCQVAVWQIRFLDIQYHQEIGGQRVSPSPRLQTPFYAASELGSTYDVDHLVGVVPAANGEYWIVVDYGTCDGSASPGGGGPTDPCDGIAVGTELSFVVSSSGCGSYSIVYLFQEDCTWLPNIGGATLTFDGELGGWVLDASDVVYFCPIGELTSAGGTFTRTDAGPCDYPAETTLFP